MKKLFYLLTIGALLLSCKVEEPEVFQIKATDMISIKSASSALSISQRANLTDAHLSNLEIVKQTTIIQYNYNGDKWERMFESGQRDTISSIPCLKMYGLDIVNQDGDYVHDFIESTDCILIKFDIHAPYGAPRDTLAYIPNKTLRDAESIIKEAYENKDLELLLNTFNNAFTFIPISGAEYKELKSSNLQ